AFLICWIPYFCIAVYRGICIGLNIKFNKDFHVNLFMVTSWLGYAHSCFNPLYDILEIKALLRANNLMELNGQRLVPESFALANESFTGFRFINGQGRSTTNPHTIYPSYRMRNIDCKKFRSIP
ncbi:unnamed protein product, partial [Thelazia callipaeda]|uniref:G_PROTEIN_RECEP_F1_2 domain-containing protein n=1 Tax=Thelazia callipaeda TaxID=103827 RepID=A0A0N5CST9_THECL